MRWRSRWVRAWAGGVAACVGGRFPTLAGVRGRPFRRERRPSTPGGGAERRDGHPSDGPMCGLSGASATCPPWSEVSLNSGALRVWELFFCLEKRVQPVASWRSYNVSQDTVSPLGVVSWVLWVGLVGPGCVVWWRTLRSAPPLALPHSLK